MKFRAKLSKESVAVLHGLLSTMEKIAETAAFFLSEDSLKIALVTDSLDSPRCFAEIRTSLLFVDYKIESQTGNTILFEIGLNQFAKALASAKYAALCQLKLVKRDNKPCLCFETTAHDSVVSVNIVHDLPIRVMKVTELVNHSPPQVAPPDVALELPRGKLLKTLMEKLVRFSRHVHVTAMQSGRLIFRVDHASVVINTFYNGLTPKFVGHLRPEEHIDNQATVKLSIKKFSSVIHLASLPYSSAGLCK